MSPPFSVPSAAEIARDELVDRLQRDLMETADPRRRARVHLELARIALSDSRVERSARHLREALVLDRRLEAARRLLQELGESSRAEARRRVRPAGVRGLLSRLRRR